MHRQKGIVERIVTEEKPMIRCSDVMKPIEAPARGTL
jgi:hypothetical protein